MQKLLLIGAGHAHAFVLEAFALQPDKTVSITVVSDSRFAAYSGSVPAWLAGECTLRETQMDIAYERAPDNTGRWERNGV